MKKMQTATTQNMGTDSIPRLFAQLAIPAVVAQIINLLYNIVDRIYIGHIPEVGASALTGVGLFLPILMLINAFAMLAGSGGAPLASIAMGEDHNDHAEKIVGNAFSLLLLFSIVLTVIFYITAPSLLHFFGASDVTLPYAVEYARIYILGSVFVLIVMGMNPFITTQGFAKISMLTTIIGAIINIILDPIFIFAFNMGVKGAAIATILSQAVGAIWILRFLTGKKTILHLKKEYMKLDLTIVKPCLALGISTFVMLATESLLSISFTSNLAHYGGDIAVGAMTIITSIGQLAIMPLQGFCQGGQPIISYNFGAKNMERVKKTFYIQFCVCVGYATFFWLICMFSPHLFTNIFTDDIALVQYSSWALRIYMFGLFAFGAQVACQQSFLALGQAKICLLLACLRKIILLIPLIFLLPIFFENKVFGVFLAEPLCDILAATVTTITFFTKFDTILAETTTSSKKETCQTLNREDILLSEV